MKIQNILQESDENFRIVNTHNSDNSLDVPVGSNLKHKLRDIPYSKLEQLFGQPLVYNDPDAEVTAEWILEVEMPDMDGDTTTRTVNVYHYYGDTPQNATLWSIGAADDYPSKQAADYIAQLIYRS